MDQFPIIHTNRLLLRKIQIEDLDSLVKYANNKKISDNIVNIPFPYREPDAAFRISFVVKGFKNKTRYVFSIILKEQQEFIGEISLHYLDEKSNNAQLAYWIGEPFWNLGIVTEATEAVIKFGFDKLDLNVIYADCRSTNLASEKVMLKNDMTQYSENGNLKYFKISKQDFYKDSSDI